MFPREDYLYKNAPKVGLIVGITQILLSGFIWKGYYNASTKVLGVYKELNLISSSGFTWGYVSIGVLLVIGILNSFIAFLIWNSKPEDKGKYYRFLVPLLFMAIISAFVCVYMFHRLVISPVNNLPDKL